MVRKLIFFGYFFFINEKLWKTHPFLDAASLAQSPFCSRDTVSYTAVAFAKAPELSTNFLGKKAKASWSE